MEARMLSQREWRLAVALAGMVVQHCAVPEREDAIWDRGLFANTEAIRLMLDLGLIVRHPTVAGGYRLLTPMELEAGGILPEGKRDSNAET